MDSRSWRRFVLMLLRLFCQSPELAPSCKMPCRQFTAKPVICSSEHLREVEACGFPRARARECRATDRLAARHVSARQRTIANFSAFVMRNDYANHSFSHITMEAEGGIRTHGGLPMQTGIGAKITRVPHTPLRSHNI